MGEKRCLVCGFEDTSSICCPNCRTLMLPKKKNFWVRELQKKEIESQSQICFGMWIVREYRINGKNVFVCNCPAFIKAGSCKHIRHVQTQEQQDQTQEQREEEQQEELSQEPEEILEEILRS